MNPHKLVRIKRENVFDLNASFLETFREPFILKTRLKTGFECMTVRFFCDFSRHFETFRDFTNSMKNYEQDKYLDAFGDFTRLLRLLGFFWTFWTENSKVTLKVTVTLVLSSHFDQTLNNPNKNFQTCRTVRDTLSRSKKDWAEYQRSKWFDCVAFHLWQ